MSDLPKASHRGRHKWRRDPRPIVLPCGCTDAAWTCGKCDKRRETPFFRRWRCPTHDKLVEQADWPKTPEPWKRSVRRIIETWLEAYDETIFPSLSRDEQALANAALKTCGVVRDRLTADFGRHMARCLLAELTKLEKAQTVTSFEPGDGAFNTCVETPNGWRRK